MPQETVKVLLAKFKFDAKDAKATIDDLRTKLAAANNEQKRKFKESLADLKLEQTIQKQIARDEMESARKKYNSVRQVLQELQRTKAATMEEGRERAKVAAEAQKELRIAEKSLEIAKRKNAEIIKEARNTALVGRATAAQSREAPGGMLHRAFGGFMRGGYMGALGGVAGGMVVGETAIMTLEYAIEKFRELTEHIKEAGKEAAMEAQQEQMLRAVAGERITSMEDFILRMRDATRHLADDSLIFSEATQAFRADNKVTADQIIQLTNASVKLGIAAHGTEGAANAINALQQYFTSGRSYVLAYALNLSSANRALLMGGQSATSAKARWASFQQTFEVVMRAAQQIPEPLLTVAMAQEQYRVTLEHLEHEIVGVVQTSPGMVAIWEAMAKRVEEMLKKFDTNKTRFTEVIDGLTKTLALFFADLAQIVSWVAPIVAEFTSWLPRLHAGFAELGAGISHIREAEAKAALKLAESNTPLGGGIRVHGMAVGPAGGAGSGLYNQMMQFQIQHGQTEAEARKAVIEQLKAEVLMRHKETKSLEESAKKYNDNANAIEKTGITAGNVATKLHHDFLEGALKPRVTPIGLEEAIKLIEANQKNLEKVVEEAKTKGLSFAMTGGVRQKLLHAGATPEILKELSKYAEAAPPSGEQLSFTQQVQHKQSEIQNAAARKENDLLREKNDLTARLTELQHQQSTGQISMTDYATKALALQNSLYQNQLENIKTEHTTKIESLHKSLDAQVLVNDKIEAENASNDKKKIEAEQTYRMAVLRIRNQETDDQRNQTKAQIDYYHQATIQRINDTEQEAEREYQLGLITLQKRLDAEKAANAASLAELRRYETEKAVFIATDSAAMTKLRQATEDKINAIIQKGLQQETKGRQEQWQLEEQSLKAQVTATQTAMSDIQSQIQIQHIAPIQAAQMSKTGILSEIQAQQALGTYYLHRLGHTQPGREQNRIIKNIQDTSKALIRLQQDLDRTGNVWDATLRTFGQGLDKMFPRGGGVFSQITSAIADSKDNATNFKNSLDELTGAGKHLKDRFKGLAGVTADLGQGIAGLAGIANNKNLTVGQAMSQGAGAGAQIGGMVGGFFKAGSMLAKAIPYVGEIAGAAFGMIEGIFTRAARRIADDVKNSITHITNAFSAGAINLSTEITQLEQTRQDAINRLSNIKGGRQQLDQILPGLDQQIAELKNQQLQTLRQFEANLGVMNLNQQIQSVGQQIDQIIQQWAQYINAGGDVQKANQFLAESFAQLRQTEMQGLNQDYEKAIQNALDYNNLLIQRQQLIQSEVEQEMGIMNQGVLVRQQTQAQSKAYQIAQLRQNTQQQLDQLNQQIATSKYQLDAEKQIFGLAQTRIGLENQLIQAKYVEINYDMQRIQALKELLAGFVAVAGGYGLTAGLENMLNVESVPGMNLVPVGLPTPGQPTPSASPSTEMSPLETVFNQYANRLGRFGQFTSAVGTSSTPQSG